MSQEEDTQSVMILSGCRRDHSSRKGRGETSHPCYNVPKVRLNFQIGDLFYNDAAELG